MKKAASPIRLPKGPSALAGYAERHRKVALAGAAGVVILLALVLNARYLGTASEADCARMTERYVDMLVDADPSLAKLSPEAREAARSIKRATSLAHPGYRKAAEACAGKIGKRAATCALEAPHADAWEACLD